MSTEPTPGNENLQPPPAVDPVASTPTSDDKTMSLIIHLGGIFTGIIVPLIIWLIKKDQSKFVDHHGKEALNFQITILIAYAIGLATWCFVVGIVIFFAAWVAAVVLGIMAALAANRGELYRYPMTIRLIK